MDGFVPQRPRRVAVRPQPLAKPARTTHKLAAPAPVALHERQTRQAYQARQNARPLPKDEPVTVDAPPERARFAGFKPRLPFTVPAWMRNGWFIFGSVSTVMIFAGLMYVFGGGAVDNPDRRPAADVAGSSVDAPADADKKTDRQQSDAVTDDEAGTASENNFPAPPASGGSSTGNRTQPATQARPAPPPPSTPPAAVSPTPPATETSPPAGNQDAGCAETGSCEPPANESEGSAQ